MFKQRRTQFDLFTNLVEEKTESDQPPGRIYNVEDDEPKDVALRIFKIFRLQQIALEKQKQIVVNENKVIPKQIDIKKYKFNFKSSSSDSDSDTDIVSDSNSDSKPHSYSRSNSPSDSDSSSSSHEPRKRPRFIECRYKKRRGRFLRMAKTLFHINSMREFCKSAQIQNEKELIRKYETLLVNIESGCNELAKKKHAARLLKKQKEKLKYMNKNFESDVSTPDVSVESVSSGLPEEDVALLSPVSRTAYKYRNDKTFNSCSWNITL